MQSACKILNPELLQWALIYSLLKSIVIPVLPCLVCLSGFQPAGLVCTWFRFWFCEPQTLAVHFHISFKLKLAFVCCCCLSGPAFVSPCCIAGTTGLFLCILCQCCIMCLFMCVCVWKTVLSWSSTLFFSTLKLVHVTPTPVKQWKVHHKPQKHNNTLHPIIIILSSVFSVVSALKRPVGPFS